MKSREERSTFPFVWNGSLEAEYVASGLKVIVGVDEAGRGPLAGPVVAAAVAFRDCDTLWAARDSKKMTPRARARYFDLAVADLGHAVGICSVDEIDRLNILRASLLAMEKAVAGLQTTPEIVLVDGNQRLSAAIPSRAIVHGDDRVAVIGAASIIAKVTRDRIMADYDRQFPGYGFARHFGYPTAEHRKQLMRLGPCPIHRRTFHGVREFFQATAGEANK
jgi:ribonuclease HII